MIRLAAVTLALAACIALPNLLVAQTQAEQARVLQLLKAGSEATNSGDLAAAEEDFQAATEAAPGFSTAFLGLGIVQVRRGELKEAIATLQRTTQLNPKLPGAHLFLGIAEYQLVQTEAALASFRTETELQPQSSEAFTWLGIVELNQNHPELATAALDRAKALNPNDPRILYYCGRAHLLQAEADYRHLRELAPDSALVHRALAESFAMGDQPEKAIAEFEAAVAADPRNPDLYEALGEADLKMSRRAGAQHAYEQALKWNPNSAIALYNLGRLDVEGGQPQAGVPLLQEAQNLHASPAPTGFYLGLGLAELGHNDEAARALERCLADGPSSFIEQSAYYQLARVYQKLNRKADAQRALAVLTRLKAESAQSSGQPEKSTNTPAHPKQPTMER